ESRARSFCLMLLRNRSGDLSSLASIHAHGYACLLLPPMAHSVSYARITARQMRSLPKILDSRDLSRHHWLLRFKMLASMNKPKSMEPNLRSDSRIFGAHKRRWNRLRSNE